MAELANVLVVDDDLGPRESMRMILKPHYNVLTADDGFKALEMIEKHPIDLVTLDLKMPGMHGIDVLKAIKKNNPQIEVIIVTGYGTLKSATEAMKYGVKGYITKPYNLGEITSVVEKAIEQRRFNLKLRNFFKEALLSDTPLPPDGGESDPSPLPDNDLEKSNVSENLLDVTEYKIRKIKEMRDDFSRENNVLEEKLIRSERLALVGQMAAGYAHELNNSLTTMLGYTQLVHNAIRTNYPELKDLLGRIATISNQTHRASQLTQSLLDVSRKKTSQREPTDVTALVAQVLSYTEYRAHAQGLTVIKDFEPSLPRISVDPRKVEQVFLNLILNSFQAMAKGGTLSIAARQVKGDMGSQVEVAFADTGHGIAAEHIKEIFDPFFSTKDENKGTGLGLFIARKIVESYQGSIEVRSEKGTGTTFTVSFPALQG